MTTQMQALTIESYGDEGVIQIAEVARPDPGTGEVRIRVRASSVNPVDLAVRSGMLDAAGFLAPGGLPVGLGWDVAGEIDQAGPRTGRFALGDQVIALVDSLDLRTGGQAEWVVVPEASVALAPRGSQAAGASTLPLNGLTAWQALDRLALPAGGTIIITGAAGGLGGLGVELAAARGLRVIAQTSSADEALVRGLGAHDIVHRADDLASRVRELVPPGADGALDAAGVGNAARDAVRSGGTFVAVRPGDAPQPLRDVTVHVLHVGVDAGQLTALARLAEAGHLTLRVAEVLPLARAADAHRRLAGGGVRGRLVLEP